jgi:asparagine synthase (glutamine-hydrolysing)
MCAINGIYAYHRVARDCDRSELRAVRDAMSARGPDGSGEWFSTDNRVALGHRRLSIIDLSDRASQPMASADGQIVVTFNGEIYNYRALRAELESKGHRFRTESDTEVLLELYRDRGERMVEVLRGMFAFAIWDAQKHAMLFARDPYGIKPLYYADDGWTLRFASQVKALLHAAAVSRAPEPAGTVGFYLFGSVPEPFTLYREIRAVPAGSFQWVDEIGPHEPIAYSSIAKEWERASHAGNVSASEIDTAMRGALQDSVRHHLVADVPVGAFLSAGIDSGALVGLMRDVGQQTIQTITLSFDEFRGTASDESLLAADVAAHYGTQHANRVVTEAEFRADLPKILDAMDQPSIDGINTWFVSKAAHEIGLKVAISGVGGDELLGGYPSFRDLPRWIGRFGWASRIPGLGAIAEIVLDAFAPLKRSLNPKAAGMLRYSGDYAGAYLLRRGLFLPRELSGVLDRDLVREGLRRLSPFAEMQRAMPNTENEFAKVASLEASLYMRNQLLRDTDWASMAHSLEVRTPLVDSVLLRNLAPLALSMPLGEGKRALARAPTRALPQTIVDRAKTGFATPIAQWQERVDSLRAWRESPRLSRPMTPWARRWGYEVASTPSFSV